MTAYPGDTGPIVRHPIGLPITAKCDTAWIQSMDCSDASCTEMQYLRPLRQLWALITWHIERINKKTANYNAIWP